MLIGIYTQLKCMSQNFTWLSIQTLIQCSYILDSYREEHDGRHCI